MLLIPILYLVTVLIYLLICLFIAYHIIKYSLNQKTKLFTLLLFSVVSGLLFIINLTLFFSIQWGTVVENFLP